MDSQEIKITLNVTSRILNQEKMKRIHKAIEDAIYNEISEIDKKSSPIFLQIEIEDNCIFKGI